MRWWLGMAFAFVGVITAASVYLFVTDSSERVIGERSNEIAVGRTVRVADRIGSASPDLTRELLARNRAEGYAAWAFDRDGNLLSPSDVAGVRLRDFSDREQAVSQALTGGRYINDQTRNTVTLVAVPIFRDGKVDGALLAHASRPQALQRSVDKLKGDSLTALGIAIGVGILVGFLVAGVIAGRVKRLAESAGNIAAGRFDIPLDPPGPDEIGDLSEALDSMREALRESFNVLSSERDKLSGIFAGLTDAVMVVGNDGAVRFANPAAERLLVSGPSPDGDSPTAGEPVDELRSLLRRASEKGTASQDVLHVGESVYAAQARDLPAEQAVLAVVRDRTEELRRELAEREFVSNAAHELRNPIAGISSSIEVLQSGAKDDPEALERFLSRLSDDAERLKRITQSLLTLARVEAAGEDDVHVVDVVLAAQEAIQAIDPPQGIDVEIDVPPDLAATGDPVLLRQVLVGLVSNAYKNTPPPGTVKVRGRRVGENEVVIEVSDTGVGIAPDEIDRVFERFYRARGSLEKDGFGLGLSIAKRMVDVMGGDLGVTSREGKGSTFWVRLTVPAPTPTPVP